MSVRLQPGDLIDFVARLRLERRAFDAAGFAAHNAHDALKAYGIDAETIQRARLAAERAGQWVDRLITQIEATAEYKAAARNLNGND